MKIRIIYETVISRYFVQVKRWFWWEDDSSFGHPSMDAAMIRLRQLKDLEISKNPDKYYNKVVHEEIV